MISILLAIGFFGLCAYAAAKDVAAMLIPNRINIAIAGLFLPAALAAGVSIETTATHMAWGAGALAAGALLFFARIWGGGDAKMLPAVVLWIGPAGITDFLVAMAYSGGVLCVVVIALRRLLPRTEPDAPNPIVSLRPGEGAPYGVAIAAGAIFAAPASPLLTELLRQFSGLH